MADLENSMSCDPDGHPLAIEHARVLQGAMDARRVLQAALDLYVANQGRASAVQLQFLTVPAIESTLRILHDILPEDEIRRTAFVVR